MAKHHGASSYTFAVALAIGVLAAIPSVESIGVGYGVNGDDLPSASEVVQLYKSNGITAMRVYTVNSNTLQALSGSGIGLILDTGNDQLASLAASAANADAWVKANVQSHQGLTVKYIAVGNEVPDQGGKTSDILPAMKNVHDALARASRPPSAPSLPPTCHPSRSTLPASARRCSPTYTPTSPTRATPPTSALTTPSSARRARWSRTTTVTNTRTCSTRSWTPCTPRSRAPGPGPSVSWCPSAGGRPPATQWPPWTTHGRTTRI